MVELGAVNAVVVGSNPTRDSRISGGRIVAIPLALGARYREFDSRSPD